MAKTLNIVCVVGIMMIIFAGGLGLGFHMLEDTWETHQHRETELRKVQQGYYEGVFDACNVFNDVMLVALQETRLHEERSCLEFVSFQLEKQLYENNHLEPRLDNWIDGQQ